MIIQMDVILKYCRRLFCSGSMASLLAFACPLSASDSESAFDYMTLNGLTTVSVNVEGMRRNFKNLGLDESVILASAEAELASSGIQVVDIEAARLIPSAAFLRIKLTTNENQYGFYNYGASVELKQKIALNNAAGGYISGTIWKQGKTGIVMPTELAKISVAISELLMQFIADYRAQNPATSHAAD
jgi:hypothetical protein